MESLNAANASAKHLRTIKGLRHDLNLTQMEMAEKLNIPIANYQRYERLEVMPPLDVVVDIADMVGIVDIREIKYK